MTVDEYHAKLRDLGLTRRQFTYEGGCIYEGRDKLFYNIADPEPLDAAERMALIDLYSSIVGD